MKLGIINYGSGNLHSVTKAVPEHHPNTPIPSLRADCGRQKRIYNDVLSRRVQFKHAFT